MTKSQLTAALAAQGIKVRGNFVRKSDIRAFVAKASGKLSPNDIPKDFPVQPLKPGQKAGDKVTCGTCGLSWDDSISTSMTPAPSARCPFEAFHKDVGASLVQAANTHDLVKKVADKAHVDEEKLEHYLLGGPGSKDPTFTKELHTKTGMPDNWDTLEDLDAWLAKMGLNSREILKMFKAAHSSVTTAEEWHIKPEVFGQINQHFSTAINELGKAKDLVEEHHQQIEALEPKFRDRVLKAFKELEEEIQELSTLLGENKD